MITNYTWCLLLFAKETDEMVHDYFIHMYSTFGWITQDFARQWYYVQQ